MVLVKGLNDTLAPSMIHGTRGYRISFEIVFGWNVIFNGCSIPGDKYPTAGSIEKSGLKI